MKAIAIIQDEHRAITAVIEGLRHLLEEIASGRIAPDHVLLRALFGYIEQFPERLHHPKEDEFLFAKLRLRRPDAAPLLDALSREHEVGRERFTELKAAYEEFAADPSTGEEPSMPTSPSSRTPRQHGRRGARCMPGVVGPARRTDLLQVDREGRRGPANVGPPGGARPASL